MSNYDFILENLKFSFSSVSTFQTCAYNFYLTYIDSKPRNSNYFSDYGLLCHDILEKYFKGELEIFELSTYYQEHYAEFVTHDPPPYPIGMADKYYNDGLDFFDNFDLNINDFEILITEDKIESSVGNNKIVIKPDLVMKEKSSGKVFLYDYKTAIIHKNGKTDKKKLSGYKDQMNLYAYFIEQELGIKIDGVKLWFIRTKTEEYFDYKKDDAEKVVRNLFSDTINKILIEEDFKADTSNKYFCENLCSVKDYCEFWKTGD